MNDRIREFAEKARYKIYDSNGDLVEFGINENMFASLIVQACADIAMEQRQSNSFDIYGLLDDYDKGCTDTASLIASKISNFFYS
jgi:hypothetical protein